MKEKYVKICPQCKSIDIEQEKHNYLQSTSTIPFNYICNKCGHSSKFFPEIEISKLEEFQKEVDKKRARNLEKDQTPLVDTSYGKFEVRFWWKVLSIIFLVLGTISFFYHWMVGLSFLIPGLFMFYITFFRKRKLKD